MASQNPTPWEKIPPKSRKSLVWSLWFITWLGLLAGLYDRAYYVAVVGLSVAHAILFLVLHRFRLSPFPVQVRVAYVIWVAIGTWVPYMTFLMYITTLGLVGNLFFMYCPLARLLNLMPWNREETFSFGLVKRVFLSPPVDGRFRPAPPAAPTQPR